jgi:hypothetical protein
VLKEIVALNRLTFEPLHPSFSLPYRQMRILSPSAGDVSSLHAKITQSRHRDQRRRPTNPNHRRLIHQAVTNIRR